jgi:hypothetical protein
MKITEVKKENATSWQVRLGEKDMPYTKILPESQLSVFIHFI